MQSVLPYTTKPEQMRACEKMKLLNPHSAMVTGPYVTLRTPKLIEGGLLNNWDADAALNTVLAPPKPVETWDVSWTAAETHWEENVQSATCPEEVEDLLPSKWIGYNTSTEVDVTLARVCKLCTALVDKFVALSANDNEIASTSRWRQKQLLFDRLGAVMELLEASIGEAIPLLKLRDSEFVKQCWDQLQEEERMDVITALGDENIEAEKLYSL